MLKIYRLSDGRTYQFEEGEQPKDAVEIKKEEPKKNKSRQVKNK